jgi:hypothetical protein
MKNRVLLQFLAVFLIIAGSCAAVGAQETGSMPEANATPQTSTTPAYQPKFPGDPAKSEAEAQALGYMRVVLRAEKIYKKRHNKFATSLPELAGTGSFTKRMSRTTDRGDYTVSFHSKKEGFVLTMVPKQFDSQHRAFYADDDGIIHAEEGQAATEQSPRLK